MGLHTVATNRCLAALPDNCQAFLGCLQFHTVSAEEGGHDVTL